jgi:predicted acyl esterase
LDDYLSQQYLPLKRYRFIRQPEPITFSAYTSWEAPDPSYWVPRGYAVVNVDFRGFGTSGGVGTFLSDQEAADYAEVIEWAARNLSTSVRQPMREFTEQLRRS